MSSDPEISVIGAGGHGKAVVAALQAAGYVVTCAYDDDLSKWEDEEPMPRLKKPWPSGSTSHQRFLSLCVRKNPVALKVTSVVPPRGHQVPG